jgi:hypothetical protein
MSAAWRKSMQGWKFTLCEKIDALFLYEIKAVSRSER